MAGIGVGHRFLSSVSHLQADGLVSCKRTECLETCPHPIQIPGQCCPDCSAGDGAWGQEAICSSELPSISHQEHPPEGRSPHQILRGGNENSHPAAEPQVEQPVKRDAPLHCLAGSWPLCLGRCQLGHLRRVCTISISAREPHPPCTCQMLRTGNGVVHLKSQANFLTCTQPCFHSDCYIWHVQSRME